MRESHFREGFVAKEPLKLDELSKEKLLKIVLDDLSLIRRGVDLAERREKRISYVMELQCVLEMLDVLTGRVRALAGKGNAHAAEEGLQGL
jgi:hypothetical protein